MLCYSYPSMDLFEFAKVRNGWGGGGRVEQSCHWSLTRQRSVTHIVWVVFKRPEEHETRKERRSHGYISHSTSACMDWNAGRQVVCIIERMEIAIGSLSHPRSSSFLGQLLIQLYNSNFRKKKGKEKTTTKRTKS